MCHAEFTRITGCSFSKQRWTTQTFENPVEITGKERLSFAGAILNKTTKASFRKIFFFLSQIVSNVHVTLKRVACHMLSLLSIKSLLTAIKIRSDFHDTRKTDH